MCCFQDTGRLVFLTPDNPIYCVRSWEWSRPENALCSPWRDSVWEDSVLVAHRPPSPTDDDVRSGYAGVFGHTTFDRSDHFTIIGVCAAYGAVVIHGSGWGGPGVRAEAMEIVELFPPGVRNWKERLEQRYRVPITSARHVASRLKAWQRHA